MSLESRAHRLITEHPEQGGADALTIAGLYARIDRALREALPGQVWVSGEVRSLSVSPAGHRYIHLVDPKHAHDNGTPVLKVVCWSSRWRTVRSTLDRLGITLDAGMVVRVRGEAQLYKPHGDISFKLSELDTDALLGKVAAERARLIKALVDEELFDRNRRIAVPRVPIRIGLVASPETEGCRDFLGSLEGSGMAFEVALVPTRVQGRGAAGAVATAITRLQGRDRDVIVVVRGGGSKADLGTFDAEPVARAIATSDTPVWTGIGHTGDQSVADEVANRSFITPTECGQELARLVVEFWRCGMEAGILAARMAEEEVARAERGLDRSRHRTATGTRSQLDRRADGLDHRARILPRYRPRSVGCPLPAPDRPVRTPRPGRRSWPAHRGGDLPRCHPPPGRAPRPTSRLRGPPSRPVATSPRGLRLPAPARTRLLGDPRRIGRSGAHGGRSGSGCRAGHPPLRRRGLLHGHLAQCGD